MEKHPLLDLVIVGAYKSYTTSLKEYIGGHPSVITHPQKELAFFSDDKEYKRGYEKALTHYYKSIERCRDKKMLAKSAILYTSEKAIKRLHEHNPNCKIILSLRNPVDRAYSAYLLEYNHATVEFPFEEIKGVAEKADTNYWPFNLFIDAGNYAKHLKNIYKYFPKEQVMVVLSEEIKEEPLETCNKIFRWMGIHTNYTPHIKIHNPTLKRRSRRYAKLAKRLLQNSPIIRKSASLLVPSHYNYKIGDIIRNVNKTSESYETMDSVTRQYLLSYYSDANKKLEEMTDKKVTSIWNK